MSGRLVLDIETVPLAASLELAYPKADRAIPANYKDPVVIANWYAKDEAAWRASHSKRCSIDPRLGRVLCIGTDGNDTPIAQYAYREDQEREILVGFWDLVKAWGGSVVTWNGQFDLNFIVKRSMANRVKPTIAPTILREWFSRYRTDPHFDCKAVLLNWDNQLMKSAGEGLDEWAKFLGVQGKQGNTDGGDVAWMFDEGQHELIKEYCLQDVASTKAIYEVLSAFYGG